MHNEKGESKKTHRAEMKSGLKESKREAAEKHLKMCKKMQKGCK